MTQPNSPKDPLDHLFIKLGRHFEVSARGKLAILVVALVLAVALATLVGQSWTDLPVAAGP